jgi:HPt (histidine-containing phosphotransfer) domain-containing protein
MNYKFINTVYLETIVSGGDKEIIRELVGIFREQVVEMVKEMNSLYAKEDFYSLAMLAHKAKSSVAIMGMNDLAIMLKTFELEGKDGTNKENYKLYILRFENETRQAVEELENYINNL